VAQLHSARLGSVWDVIVLRTRRPPNASETPPGKGGWDTTTTTRDGERGDSSLLRSGQGATYRCSPLPHMDTIWMWNTMHACSAGPVGRLACGEPSFTPTLNTTTPAVSLSLASQCSVGLCLGCDSVTNTTSPQCLRNPIAVSPDISAPVRGHRCSLSSS